MTRIKNVRNTTKFKRSIKAISPVIATLLMIAIAVVSSLVVYAWVSGYMGFQTTKAGKEIQLQSFALDNSNKLHVYVQNVGQGLVTINAAYVNDSLQNITPDSNYPDNGLPEGKTADITVAGTYNTNDKLNIKVTTTDGTFMTTIGKVTSSSSGSIVNYNIVVTNPAGSHGTITPAGTTSYAAGSTPSFTISPDVGYHIASVTTNAGAQALASPYVFPALSADGTLTATFAANTVNYNIVVTNPAGSHGTITPAGTTSYAAGSTPSFTISPDVGYHIASVTTNAGAQALASPYVFPALSADGTLTATFAANTVNYNIVVTNPAGSHGTITPAGTTSYAAGSTPSFTISPDVGYHIASVTTNAGAQALASPYVFPALSADGTLTATFAANTPLTLTLRPNGVGNAAELDRNTGTQNYMAVDEAVADGTTSYVSRSSSSTGFFTDTYATEDTSTTGTINYVKIYAVCNYDGGTATPHARTVLRVSGTDYYGYDTTAITSTWSTISTTYNTNPAGGNWDWAAINALQSGVDLYRTSNGGTIRCTQVYVEVNYTP